MTTDPDSRDERDMSAQSQPCDEASADAEVFAGLKAEPSAGFTPPPWRLEIRPGHFSVRAKYVVARLSIATNSVHRAEGLATGHLIAAAPDLFEACQALVSAIGDLAYPHEDAGLVIQAPFEMARAAVAKALGLSAQDTAEQSGKPRETTSISEPNPTRGGVKL